MSSSRQPCSLRVTYKHGEVLLIAKLKLVCLLYRDEVSDAFLLCQASLPGNLQKETSGDDFGFHKAAAAVQ